MHKWQGKIMFLWNFVETKINDWIAFVWKPIAFVENSVYGFQFAKNAGFSKGFNEIEDE